MQTTHGSKFPAPKRDDQPFWRAAANKVHDGDGRALVAGVAHGVHQ
jgi:hypothetical protein